mgnify:CR=1 FL=1
MKVHIEGNLYLESDQYQYLLKEYSGKTYTNEKGEEREGFRVLGYYGTIEQAIRSLVEKKIKQSAATNLKELLEEVKIIKAEISEKITV